MGGLIPESFIEELLGRADIVELVERHVPLKRAGREYQACCPFHDEKTPSFTVSPQKQFYHCFGCGAHGSAIGFLMNYEGLEFVDAVEIGNGKLSPDENAMAFKVTEKLGLPGTGGSDAHRVDEIGTWVTVFEKEIEIEIELVQELLCDSRNVWHGLLVGRVCLG